MQRRLAVALTALLSACPKPQPQVAQVGPPAPPPAAPAPVAPGPERVTLLFAASTAGQLVPCGCSPDQRGGLPRTVQYVRELRKTEPHLLFADAGDLLFDSAARPADQLITQFQLKARALASEELLAGAVARAVGPRDLAMGAAFAQEVAQGVPLLDAGVAPLPGAQASLLADANGIPVGLFAAGYEEDTAATIAARAKELRAKGARLVVLFLLPHGANTFAAAQALLPAARAAGVDLAVLGRLDDPSTDTDRKDTQGPPLFAVEGHGQSLLRIDVTLGKGPLALAPSQEDKDEELKLLDGRIARFRGQVQSYPERKAQLQGKIDELVARRETLAKAKLEEPAAGSTFARARFVPMDKSIASAPDGQKLVDDYDDKVAALNLAEAKLQPEECAPAARGEAAYVGVSQCAQCHDSEARFWSQTRHAHAYETLTAVKKQFNLDCIRCHVTGWQQPGGVCRIDRTATGSPGISGGRGQGRQDVQCEDCHGPGGLHADDPTVRMKKDVPAQWCQRCHEPANSPRFDDAKYRPYIVGPGHGMPLARGETARPRAGGPNQ